MFFSSVSEPLGNYSYAHCSTGSVYLTGKCEVIAEMGWVLLLLYLGGGGESFDSDRVLILLILLQL